jgi:pimeloyl-ACP methyl ester carboxylesterase
LDKLGISNATFVGHSIAGVELTSLAAHYPGCVSQLIFLDAASTSADDEELAATMPIAYPEPSPDHLVSLDPYRLWLQENMFAGHWTESLEADLRETTSEHPDGSFGPIMPDHVANLLMANELELGLLADRFIPVLSIHAITDQFPGFESITDPALREEVEHWVQDVAIPLQRSIAARFREQVPHAKVVELEGANHFCFIDREKEVAKYIHEFLDDEE